VARELVQLGHQVTAYCHILAEDGGEGDHDGVAYRDVARVDELTGGSELDLFVCSRYFGVLARPIRARTRVLWLHDLVLPELAPQIVACAGGVDRVHVLSEYHQRQVAGVLPALADRLTITRNGVDLALVASATRGTRKQHRIMYTSRPERGLLRALELHERLGDRALELLVCTYPYAGDARVRAIEAACHARLDDLAGRGYRVRRAAFDKPALYRHIAESELVLYPSEFQETSCLSAIEAQACGTVFLTSDGSALGEAVGYPGIHGDDLGAFERRLRELLADPARRRALEAAGRAHVAGQTWTGVARRFVEDAERTPARAAAPVRRARPRVSCLTVTRQRLRLLKRAISHYTTQTYAERELVIVAQGDARYRQALLDHVASLGRDDLRVHFFDDGLNLGQLRNASMELARGELVCQWDDDDAYHSERLRLQIEHLQREQAAACYLTDHLQVFPRERAVHWVDWTTMTGPEFPRWHLAPGTLLMEKDARFRYPEAGEAAVRGEDSALLHQLFDAVPVAALRDAGHLYLYAYHGRNTYSYEHHAALKWRTKPLAFLRAREPELRRALRDFDIPRPFRVVAGDEVAFVVNE